MKNKLRILGITGVMILGLMSKVTGDRKTGGMGDYMSVAKYKTYDMGNHRLHNKKREGSSIGSMERCVKIPEICLQPFDDMPDGQAEYLLKAIQKMYPLVSLKPAIELPEQAWYASGAHYRADSLIGWISDRAPQGCVVLGLTSMDISATLDDEDDGEVLGFGFNPGNSSIVSTFRLKKFARRFQLLKVALHELGHNFGLHHCSDPNCYMKDSDSFAINEQETGFCEKCRSILKTKGWRF